MWSFAWFGATPFAGRKIFPPALLSLAAKPHGSDASVATPRGLGGRGSLRPRHHRTSSPATPTQTITAMTNPFACPFSANGKHQHRNTDQSDRIRARLVGDPGLVIPHLSTLSTAYPENPSASRPSRSSHTPSNPASQANRIDRSDCTDDLAASLS